MRTQFVILLAGLFVLSGLMGCTEEDEFTGAKLSTIHFSTGNGVTEPDGSITVLKGTPVTLNLTHTGGAEGIYGDVTIVDGIGARVFYADLVPNQNSQAFEIDTALVSLGTLYPFTININTPNAGRAVYQANSFPSIGEFYLETLEGGGENSMKMSSILVPIVNVSDSSGNIDPTNDPGTTDPGTTGASISTDPAAPTALALDTPTVYALPNNTKGYINIPDTPGTDTEGFGVYVSGGQPSLYIGYWNGSWIGSIGGVKDATANTVRAGVQGSAATADYVAELVNYTGADLEFTVNFRKATMGGTFIGNEVAVSLGAATWLGSGLFGPFTVGANGNLNVAMTDLNQGPRLQVFDGASALKDSTFFAETVASANHTFSGLSGVVYLKIDNNGSNYGPVIGNVTVTTD